MANPWDNDPLARPRGARSAGPWDSDPLASAPPARPAPSLGERAFAVASGPVRSAFGTGEAVAHVGSQFFAGIPAGLSYLGTLGARVAAGDSYREADKAGQYVMGETQRAATYQPRSDYGRAAAEGADAVLGLPARGADAAGSAVARWTDSPALGTAANVGLQALGMYATGRLGGAVARRAAVTGPTAVNAIRTTPAAVRTVLNATDAEGRLLATRPQAMHTPEEPLAPPVEAPPAAPDPHAAAGEAAFGAPAAPEAPRAAAPAPSTMGMTRVLGMARGAVAAATDPLTMRGPEQAALRMLLRFGMKPEDFANLTDKPSVTGTRTTLPEQVPSIEGATGTAALLDSLSNDPKTEGMVNARRIGNNRNRLNVLDQMAGVAKPGEEIGPRDAAFAARQAASKAAYDAALEEDINPALLTEPEVAHIASVFNRPAVADAIARAQQNLANEGYRDLPPFSMRSLHETQIALKDMAQAARVQASQPGATAAQYSMRSLESARRALIDIMESYSPGYRDARLGHAAASGPINQFDTIAEVKRAGTSDLLNVGGDPNLQPAALARATDAAGQAKTLRNAIGRGMFQRFDQVLAPQQMQTLSQVVAEVQRQGAIERAGRGAGSPTAKRLVTENIMRAMEFGSEGQHPITEAAVNRVLGAFEHFTNAPLDARLRMAIADLVLNPGKAAEAFRRATPRLQASRAAGVPAKPARPGSGGAAPRTRPAKP